MRFVCFHSTFNDLMKTPGIKTEALLILDIWRHGAPFRADILTSLSAYEPLSTDK